MPNGEMIEAVKIAVKEALNEGVKDFYIEREMHYQHHMFMSDMIKFFEKTKSTVCGTITKIVITALVGLVALGVIFFGKGHMK